MTRLYMCTTDATHAADCRQKDTFNCLSIKLDRYHHRHHHHFNMRKMADKTHLSQYLLTPSSEVQGELSTKCQLL